MEHPNHDLGSELEPRERFRSTLEDGLPPHEDKTEYKTMIRHCKDRVRWIERYSQRLTPDLIAHEPMTVIEERLHRIESSGWKNTIVRKEDMEDPIILRTKIVTDMQKIESNAAARSIYCYKCWGIVTTGATCVPCVTCGLVAHSSCVKQQPVASYSVFDTHPSSPRQRVKKEPDADDVIYRLDFQPLTLEQLPTLALREVVTSLELDKTTEVNLDYIILREIKKDTDTALAFRVLKTILYRIKPTVRILRLCFNAFSFDWQVYFLEWVKQNNTLEVLHIIGTGFTSDIKAMLIAVWKKNLSSHKMLNNNEILMRVDLDNFRSMPEGGDQVLATLQKQSI